MDTTYRYSSDTFKISRLYLFAILVEFDCLLLLALGSSQRGSSKARVLMMDRIGEKVIQAEPEVSLAP